MARSGCRARRRSGVHSPARRSLMRPVPSQRPRTAAAVPPPAAAVLLAAALLRGRRLRQPADAHRPLDAPGDRPGRHSLPGACRSTARRDRARDQPLTDAERTAFLTQRAGAAGDAFTAASSGRHLHLAVAAPGVCRPTSRRSRSGCSQRRQRDAAAARLHAGLRAAAPERGRCRPRGWSRR